MSEDDIDPKAALAAIQDARARMGGKLDYPAWWDVIYGLIFAALVGGAALDNPWGILLFAFSMGVLALLVKWWREKVGWWVNGYAPKKARWVAIGMVLIMFVLMAGSYWTRWGDGPAWLPFVTAALAAIVGIVGGRVWMAVYRKELEEVS